MLCPHCAVELQNSNQHGVEIDLCPNCHGAWFDRDEMRRLKDESAPQISWLDFDLWKHPENFTLASTAMQCPKCARPLATVEYENTQVLVEVCPHCQGVWLGLGQFEQILQALEDEAAGKDVHEYIAASLQEARELVTGKESLASEWRDLRHVLRMLEYRLLAENQRLAELLSAYGQSTPFK